jgi:tRNA(fMet)-specific endonuclease VapC
MPSPSLLDTDILSELFKGNDLVRANAATYLQNFGRLTISHITKYEILKGLKAKKALKQIEAFNKFCSLNEILPITDPVVEKAADIYATLREKGKPISDADILVAAIALINNLALVTNNTAHFTNIEELRLSNWKKLPNE